MARIARAERYTMRDSDARQLYGFRWQNWTSLYGPFIVRYQAQAALSGTDLLGAWAVEDTRLTGDKTIAQFSALDRQGAIKDAVARVEAVAR